MADDEKREQQDTDTDRAEDLEVQDEAEDVKGGLRSNPDGGLQRA